MRASRRRFLRVSALGAASAAVLAACGGAAAPPTVTPTPALVPTLVPQPAATKPAAAAGQSVKLSLWHSWGNNPNEGGSQANIELIEAFEFKRLIEAGDEVVVTYESTKTDGRRLRNTEVLTFVGDKICKAEVYFGWDLD